MLLSYLNFDVWAPDMGPSASWGIPGPSRVPVMYIKGVHGSQGKGPILAAHGIPGKTLCVSRTGQRATMTISYWQKVPKILWFPVWGFPTVPAFSAGGKPH